MSDADLVNTVLQRLSALDKACCDFLDADEATPRQAHTVLQRLRTLNQRVEDLVPFISEQLNALAIRILKSDPGDWAVRFLEDVVRRAGEEPELLLKRVRKRRASLSKLAILLRNSEAANQPETVISRETRSSDPQLSEIDTRPKAKIEVEKPARQTASCDMTPGREVALPTCHFGLDDPTPPGIPDPAWQQLQYVRHHVTALIRYAYEPNPNGSRTFSAAGGAVVSPAPHNYGPAVANLIERCLDVKRSLKSAVPGLSLPEPPSMPPDLCDLNLTLSDLRRWLVFKSAIEKLSEWVNQCRAAVKIAVPDGESTPPPPLPLPNNDSSDPPAFDEQAPIPIFGTLKSYEVLSARLLSLLSDYLPLPSLWDLERHEQQIAIAVREATGLTPEHWAKLDKPSREPWLERTIELLQQRETGATPLAQGAGADGGSTIPVSRTDPPKIAEAIRELIRTIERPVGLSEDGQPYTPSYIVHRAGEKFLAVLMPRGIHFNEVCEDIDESQLDLRVQARLNELRRLLIAGPFWPDEVLRRKAETIIWLEDILKELRPVQPAITPTRSTNENNDPPPRQPVEVQAPAPASTAPWKEPANPPSPMAVYTGSPIFPDSDEYQVLGDAPADMVKMFPPPAAGRFVLVLPSRTVNGHAGLQGEQRFIPVHPFLALAWQVESGPTRQLREVWHPTNGYRVQGNHKEATWLPDGWGIDMFPAGWGWSQLKAWFDKAIETADLERNDLPRDAEKGPPSCPAGRQLVAHAYMIVQHLKLPNSPVEPYGPMTPAGCVGQLRHVLHYLGSALNQPAGTPARPANENNESPACQPVEAQTPSRPPTIAEIDLEAQALALLFQKPDWSIPQIADYLKVNRKTPYKWTKFREAAECRGKLKPRGLKDRHPRRGHKSRDGQVEAYQDEDEDD